MFDRAALIDACSEHGRVARVVITAVRGSAPRDVGASMLVWKDGQSGTIGGGALEYALANTARGLDRDQASQHALGPGLGQCCGGSVEVLSEVYDLPRARALPQDVIARGPGPRPPQVERLLREPIPVMPLKVGRWFIEPVRQPGAPLWIWGAGHVGRALIEVLHDAPDLSLTWVDTGPERFPHAVPLGVTTLPATQPERLVLHAPPDAHHLILTYSHDLDLALCHSLLSHGFATCGLIGSATKWARFRSRLGDLGHAPIEIDRITCPIGDPRLGKHPKQIAVGVAHAVMTDLMGMTGQQVDNQNQRARG